VKKIRCNLYDDGGKKGDINSVKGIVEGIVEGLFVIYTI